MTPYYSHDGITIYHGDCRDVLPTLSADLVLTDPPYGHGEPIGAVVLWSADPMYADAKRWDALPVDAERLSMALAAAPNSIIWGGNYFSLPRSTLLAFVGEVIARWRRLPILNCAWTNFDRPSKMYRAGSQPGRKTVSPYAETAQLAGLVSKIRPKCKD